MLDFDIEALTWLEYLIGSTSLSRSARRELLAKYSERQRYYHNAYHIAFMWYAHCTLIKQFDISRRYAYACPTGIADAIACHDVIYDMTASHGTNEADSAFWWLQHTSTPSNTWVDIAILATADHFGYTRGDLWVDWFLGLDLLALAAPYDIFRQTSFAIRAENAHMSNEDWNIRQRVFRQKAIRTPHIFKNEQLRKEFEAPARDNLRRALLQLD